MSQPSVPGRQRAGRAAPMAPDDRRRAIVEVVVPLLLQHGEGVTTKQIAEAAGIAEGTIFRVFPDKAALLLATAEETMSPAAGRDEIEDALAGVTDLRRRVLVTTERLLARSERVMAVMMALRGVWMSQPHDHRKKADPPGPPQFIIEANRALLDTLTAVFEPNAADLTVPPRTAALLLRTLALGSRHPGAGQEQLLTPDEIADALLDGIRNHHHKGEK